MNTFNFSHGGAGDQVNMVNTSNSIGIVKGQSGTPADQAIALLTREVEELRGRLTPEAARTVDDNLPVVADGTRTPGERLTALAAVSGALAAAGQSVLGLVDGVRQLLGG